MSYKATILFWQNKNVVRHEFTLNYILDSKHIQEKQHIINFTILLKVHFYVNSSVKWYQWSSMILKKIVGILLETGKFKESDPPTLHCAPVVVYERRGPQNLSFHDNASFKNSDRSKITN